MFFEPIETWGDVPTVYDLWSEYRQLRGDEVIIEPASGDSSKLGDLSVGCVESAVATYGADGDETLVTMQQERGVRHTLASSGTE